MNTRKRTRPATAVAGAAAIFKPIERSEPVGKKLKAVFRVGRATAPVCAAVEALKISAPQVRLFVASISC